jgi:hypothetical protein
VLEAHLEAARLAVAGVGEGERLLAPPRGAPGLVLLGRVAAPRARVRVEDGSVVLPRRPLDGDAAGLADEDGAALVAVRPVHRAEHHAAAVAFERQEIQLVAAGVVAVRAQVRESLRSSLSLRPRPGARVFLATCHTQRRASFVFSLSLPSGVRLRWVTRGRLIYIGFFLVPRCRRVRRGLQEDAGRVSVPWPEERSASWCGGFFCSGYVGSLFWRRLAGSVPSCGLFLGLFVMGAPM